VDYKVSATWLMTMIINGCRLILMTEAQKEQMSCSSEILASEFELMLCRVLNQVSPEC
jgi:hypothetical protein